MAQAQRSGSTPPASPLGKLLSLGPSALSGLLLIVCAIVAIAWANSPWAGGYVELLSTRMIAGVGDFALEKPLILWINDGLMAIFFLFVGLEIKREILEGTLSSPRRAALPLLAAIGGVAAPALIYVAFNAGSEHASGWAIPAATDIAFALGVLALLGSRAPLSLKVFLTALAVVDDLIAVLIIAVFYTSSLKTGALAVAGGVLVALVAANLLRVRWPAVYVVLGLVLWVAVLKSGVHATVAGVLLAFAIPARRGLKPTSFTDRVRDTLKLQNAEDPDELAPQTRIHAMRHLCDQAEGLLVRFEHALQPWVMFLIMPVFALANAGVSLAGTGLGDLTSPVSLGVCLGLLLGKPLGITAASWLAVRTGLAARPDDISWLQIHGAAWLGGIGFTMALFIANLSVTGVALTAAKLGLFVASALAAMVGAAILGRPGKAPG